VIDDFLAGKDDLFLTTLCSSILNMKMMTQLELSVSVSKTGVFSPFNLLFAFKINETDSISFFFRETVYLLFDLCFQTVGINENDL